jgi:HlyD family secretion protein
MVSYKRLHNIPGVNFFYVRKILFLIILSAILEVFTVVAILPVINVVSEYTVGNESVFLRRYASSLELTYANSLQILLFGALVGLLISSILVVRLKYWLTLEASRIGANFSTLALRAIYAKDFLSFSKIALTDVISLLTVENSRLTNQLIIPAVNIVSGLTLLFMLSIFSVLYQPLLTFVGLLIVSAIYYLIFVIVKGGLRRHGLELTRVNSKRLEICETSVAMFANVKLSRCEDIFCNRLEQQNSKYFKLNAWLKLYALLPKYVVEFLLYSFIIGFFLLELMRSQNEPSDIIQKLSLFALIGMKLLPTFQSIFTSISSLRANSNVLDKYLALLATTAKSSEEKFSGFDSISLRDVNFYFGDKLVLKDAYLHIRKGEHYAIVGESGSGKSTLIKLFLGLYTPSTGSKVWSPPVKSGALVAGAFYLGQETTLFPDTISRNVAFKSEPYKIDVERISTIFSNLRLNNLLDSEGKLIDRVIGENGFSLSGGQAQRVLIARALYYDFEVVILDEPTSALDQITSEVVQEALSKSLSEKTLIVITHDVNFASKFPNVISLAGGRVQ